MSGIRFNVSDRVQKTLADTIEETKCPEDDTVPKSSCCCNSSFSQSCPEASDVTINQNIIRIEESDLRCAQEILSITDNQAELTYCPISNSCVRIYRNGVLEDPASCYTIMGQVVTFQYDTHPDDKYIAVYEYLASGASVDSGSRIGIIEAWSGTTAAIPKGALLVDGSTVGNAGSGATYAGPAYEDLYNVIGTLYTSPAVTPDFDGGVVVNLPDAEDVFNDGTSTLVQFKAIIWYKD